MARESGEAALHLAAGLPGIWRWSGESGAQAGTIAVPPDADWLDPLLGLTFAAAVTNRIGVATGVLLLPEHNPVLVAKQAATLDVLSGGRFTLGIGIGWSADEFAALGVSRV